ncbi:hypothetical protein [Nitrospira sp. BLG_1]|uniref:hypothetical protein n=1 Tax=Nitrospira sp. BLG_1 TaxID=3395883 RepID=UPI0039BD65CE
MMTALQIDRKVKNYGEVLDVCEYLGEQDYGSGVNALMVMMKQSPLWISTVASEKYKRWLKARNDAVNDSLTKRVRKLEESTENGNQ